MRTFTRGRASDGRPARSYMSSMQTLDIVKETWQDGKRESGKSMPSTRLDDDDEEEEEEGEEEEEEKNNPSIYILI